MARIPLVTGFWACAAATTMVGRVQMASSVVPSVDLILESPVKGVLAAAEFCTGKPLPSRLDCRMRSLLGCALLAALAAPSAPVAAQSNAERVANDSYTRSHDYDLVHQRIEVRNFDWDSTSLDGRVTTTLVALRPGLDSVILDAGRGLAVTRVVDARGTILKSAAHGDTLVVYPARPVAFHDTLRFAIDYHARIDNGRGLTFIEPEGREHRPQQIWSQGEDENNHFWFPTYDFPNDKMTWELAATVPRQYSVVSNGRLVADRRNPDGTHTVTWRQDPRSATYLVSLIVAPVIRLADTWRGVPVDYYVYRADSSRARRLFGVTPDMMEVYSRLTGVRYPWAKYAQTTVADFFGGMENVSATTLIDWLPDERAYLDRPWYQWILIPHELAHQWFGDLVTCKDWANLWLNEGFATYFETLWEEHQYGADEAAYSLWQNRNSWMNNQRLYPVPMVNRNFKDATEYAGNIYGKGGWVLHMLRQQLGDAEFYRAMKHYLETNRGQNVVTADLVKAIEQATATNVDQFFDQWVNGLEQSGQHRPGV
ncbi:MAG: hypothetical protein DMD60_01175 [Gemmatimonadetes bacterium]|nr:MAG: hypothetical protein DMD60_01175 [Gemmatimonadota bacterium]